MVRYLHVTVRYSSVEFWFQFCRVQSFFWSTTTSSFITCLLYIPFASIFCIPLHNVGRILVTSIWSSFYIWFSIVSGSFAGSFTVASIFCTCCTYLHAAYRYRCIFCITVAFCIESMPGYTFWLVIWFRLMIYSSVDLYLHHIFLVFCIYLSAVFLSFYLSAFCYISFITFASFSGSLQFYSSLPASSDLVYRSFASFASRYLVLHFSTRSIVDSFTIDFGFTSGSGYIVEFHLKFWLSLVLVSSGYIWDLHDSIWSSSLPVRYLVRYSWCLFWFVFLFLLHGSHTVASFWLQFFCIWITWYLVTSIWFCRSWCTFHSSFARFLEFVYHHHRYHVLHLDSSVEFFTCQFWLQLQCTYHVQFFLHLLLHYIWILHILFIVLFFCRTSFHVARFRFCIFCICIFYRCRIWVPSGYRSYRLQVG